MTHTAGNEENGTASLREGETEATPSAAQLAPCPFCGGEARYAHNDFYNDESMARCSQCGAEAFHLKWNRRHTSEGLIAGPPNAEGVSTSTSISYSVRAELVEAMLLRMVDEFEDSTYDMTDGSQSPDRRQLCRDARALLAKAEGSPTSEREKK